MSQSQQRQQVGEVSLDEAFLSLIPQLYLKISQAIANGDDDSVIWLTDFVYRVLPPPTRRKFVVSPWSDILQSIGEPQRLEYYRNLPEYLGELDKRDRSLAFIRAERYSRCMGWIEQMNDALYKDQYMFQGHGIITTDKREVSEQPANQDIPRIMSRS